MRRALAWALALLVLGVVAWQLTFLVAARLTDEGSPDPVEVEDPGIEARSLEVSALVDGLLSGAVLQARGEEATGTAVVDTRRYRVPGTDSPLTLGESLEQSLEALEGQPRVDVYLTRPNELDVDVRIYVGKLPLFHLTLLPGGEDGGLAALTERPWVALVVTGLGQDGRSGSSVLRSSVPITVAIRPFSPFGLRQARDATVARKEVLVHLPDDPSALQAALEAVPLASGVLVDEAALEAGRVRILDLDLLGAGQLYLLDATGTDGALHAARSAGIPVIRVGERVGRDFADEAERIELLARRSRRVVITTELGQPATLEAIRWLEGVDEELRPVFVNELVERARETGD